jgi:uncharacterized membrane protein
MGFVAALIGAFLGFKIADVSGELLGIVCGALIGWGTAILFQWRRRIAELEESVTELHQRIVARDQAPSAPPPRPSAKPAEPPWTAPTEPRQTAPLDFDLPSASPPSRPAPAFAASPRESTSPAAEPAYEMSELAAIRAVREWFTGGNTVVRVGIVILFIGIAFLVRYVAQRVTVPIEFRLSAVAIVAVILLVVGWRLRLKRAAYALALQGGAIAILYLTVFAAFRLYALLPAAGAFGLLVAIAALSAALAVLQDSMAVALLGIAGGFLAPILASTGQGNHVFLFSYYAVLNAGILAIAWFRAWRALNVVGFAFTFVIGIVWGVLRYRQDFFSTTEPFLVLFFLFYLAIAILYAVRQAPNLKGSVDGTLIFGTPVIAFGIQSGLLHDEPYRLAFSALALSALYIGLAWLLHTRRRETLRLLVESFLALGVAFLTLAIPLALDGHWSAASWAFEGAALVWIGCRQNRKLPRASGALLQIGAGIVYWKDSGALAEALPILNSTYLGGLMISVASVFSSVTFLRYQRTLANYEAAASGVLFVFGLLWWLIAGVHEIDRHAAAPFEPAAMLMFLAATGFLCSVIERWLALAIARFPAICLLPVMVIAFAFAAFDVAHPVEHGGYLAWPVAFIAFYFICHRHEGPGGAPLANLLHVASLWLLTALVGWEIAWDIGHAVGGSGTWWAIGWALVPATLLWTLPKLGEAVPWPFRAHRAAYVAFAGAGLAITIAAWSVFTNITLPGGAAPLPYAPILNPLDIAQIFVLLTLARYVIHVRNVGFDLYAGVTERTWLVLFASLFFIWANAILLRTIHHWTGVPFEVDALMSSTVVQTSITIFWTLLALASMLFATRRAKRALWITGGVLLCVVVAKLLIVDLSRVATVGRIVSFVGVGVLMLIIGYFSPLPPAAPEEK